MELTLRQTLSQQLQMTQKLELSQRLVLTQQLSLQLYLKLVDFFTGLYTKAKKETYEAHGLKFEYAAIRRSHLTKKMLEWGPGFTIFKCHPLTGEVIGEPLRFVVVDYFKDYFHPPFRDKVAVHEYGESLIIGHKEANILEWGVAKLEGILGPYLNWMASLFPTKLTDLEQCSAVYDIMPEEVYASAKKRAANSDECKRVLEIMKDFGFPEEARVLIERYKAAVDEIASNIEGLGKEAHGILRNGGFHILELKFLMAHTMQSLTAKIVEMDLQAVTSTGHTIDGKWERWREQLNKEYLDGVGNTERAYTELLLRTEEEKEREKIKLEIERITPPLSNSIPLRFIFSLEIAKALKIKRKEEPKNAKQTVSPYLTKASMLAKGTLRICELEESEKGKNDKKDENTRIPSHHAELVRFHIKDLLFRAIIEATERGFSSQLSERQIETKWAKKIEETEKAFKETTGKELFTQEEARTWRNPSNVLNLYKQFCLRQMEDEKVVRFARFTGHSRARMKAVA
ncbi:hypothetical protein J4450_04605 [Candidatus Micrarchaeota archaeon]|nr:hypothetical protein [Candidatus Micrarchaeota archaeon]